MFPGQKFLSPKGYLFNDNGEFDYSLWTCDDVNECKEGFDECSSDEFCQNTVGSYWCMCEDGFWLDPEGKCADSEPIVSMLTAEFKFRITFSAVNEPISSHTGVPYYQTESL